MDYAVRNLSRTDVECSWKQTKAPNETKSVGELFPPPKEYRPLERETTYDDKQWLYSELKKYGKFNGLAWVLSPEPECQKILIDSVQDIVLSKEFCNHTANGQYFLQRLKVSEENIRGRLTCSNFGSGLNEKRATPGLIKRVFGVYDLFGVQAIQLGINNEAERLKSFENATGLQDTNYLYNTRNFYIK